MEDSMIGLAPAGTMIGDEVHVVLGAPAPFILRRIKEASDAKVANETAGYPSYKIIGNCFQLGIMDGEALEKAPKTIETVAIL